MEWNWLNFNELTQEQIDELNEDTDFIHEQLMDYLY